MELCFATNNNGKLLEIRNLLENNYKVLSLKEIGCNEELPENGTTLEANSAEKAAYIWGKYKISCFADDSGLEVDALNGEPGVYSARYAGPDCNSEKNMDKLLESLKNSKNRAAQFRTIITLILNGETHQFEGTVKGKITESRTGDKGFGYDPVFIPEGYEKSFAQMSTEEKNKISHRGIATRKLIDFLKSIG